MTASRQSELLRTCPFCAGRVASFKGPHDQTMGTCDDCGFSYVIPVTAWKVARQTAPLQTDEPSMQPVSDLQPTRDLTKCPACGLRMGLLSQHFDHVSLGCGTCHVSMSMPKATWERLTRQQT